MKKYIVAFIVMLTIGAFGFTENSVTAQSSTQVIILVSDNPADLAMAELVSNLTGFPVIVTPWGLYDPRVTGEILSNSPKRVIVIGGPMAVVPQYTYDLNISNVTVLRWWGETRYATNKAVLKGLESLGIHLNKSMILALGTDPASIRTALTLAIKEKTYLIYFPPFATPRDKEVTLVIPNWWNGNFSSLKIVRVNITNLTARFMLNSVSSKLSLVEKLINGTKYKNATEYLETASNLLQEARVYYLNGDYEDAYKLANLASGYISRALKIIQTNPNAEMDVDIIMFNLRMHGLRSLTPEQLVELKKLMKEYEEAIMEHDYEKAKKIRLIIILNYFRVYRSYKPILLAPNSNNLLLDH